MRSPQLIVYFGVLVFRCILVIEVYNDRFIRDLSKINPVSYNRL